MRAHKIMGSINSLDFASRMSVPFPSHAAYSSVEAYLLSNIIMYSIMLMIHLRPCIERIFNWKIDATNYDLQSSFFYFMKMHGIYKFLSYRPCRTMY